MRELIERMGCIGMDGGDRVRGSSVLREAVVHRKPIAARSALGRRATMTCNRIPLDWRSALTVHRCPLSRCDLVGKDGREEGQ